MAFYANDRNVKSHPALAQPIPQDKISQMIFKEMDERQRPPEGLKNPLKSEAYLSSQILRKKNQQEQDITKSKIDQLFTSINTLPQIKSQNQQ